MKKLPLIALLAISLTGCTYKSAEYSLLSNKNIDITHTKNLIRGDLVSGVNASPVIGIFGGHTDTNSALHEAINKDKCTVALTDVSITDQELWLVAIGFNSTKVEGRQLIDNSLPGCENIRY